MGANERTRYRGPYRVGVVDTQIDDDRTDSVDPVEWRRCRDRRSNNCAPRSDTHRSSTTEAMSYPQTHGAPPEYPVTDTHKQQSPRPRRYQ